MTRAHNLVQCTSRHVCPATRAIPQRWHRPHPHKECCQLRKCFRIQPLCEASKLCLSWAVWLINSSGFVSKSHEPRSYSKALFWIFPLLPRVYAVSQGFCTWKAHIQACNATTLPVAGSALNLDGRFVIFFFPQV